MQKSNKRLFANSVLELVSESRIFCRTRQGHYFFRFPDACVWGKHSAWMSTAIWRRPPRTVPALTLGQYRAEARTHYLQRNSARKPSSGRKGDRDSGGRSTRDFQVARILLLRALPQSPTHLPLGGRLGKLSPTKNTTKEISLVVFVFSPLRMQRRGISLFI